MKHVAQRMANGHRRPGGHPFFIVDPAAATGPK